MLAVFETGGKQYKVAAGDEIRVEQLPGSVGADVVFDRLLLVSKDAEVHVGQPVLEGATIHATITAQGLAKKVLVFKHKQRQRYNRRYGHRQPYTRVRINEIKLG